MLSTLNSIIQEKSNLVKHADRVAGLTTFILTTLGVIKVVLRKLFLKSVALKANSKACTAMIL